MASAQTYVYEIFGLNVKSDIPLPELPAGSPEGPHHVDIKLRSLTPSEGASTERFAVVTEGALLNIPEAGRYLVKGGSEIIVETIPEASERNLRLYLLGSAFGALLHQRGLLPLHANSIEMSGKAVAFLGHSGAGKSTMAAWFNDRGYNVLADDVCAVSTDGDGPPLAFPGIPRLRLWRDALEASGRDTADYELSFDDMDKYTVQTPTSPVRRALELAAVYLLDDDRSASQFAVERLNGIAAADAIIANTYRGRYVQQLQRSAAHLAASMAVATKVPIFRARRIWGRHCFDEQLELLEGHARQQASS